MRMMVRYTLPHEPFNSAVRDGSAGSKMKKILDEQKPEAAYFMAHNGRRCAVLIMDLPEASRIPAFAEPWFLTFNADVEVQPVMTSQDLAAAGLEQLGKKWG
jgi:hypothetical protein